MEQRVHDLENAQSSLQAQVSSRPRIKLLCGLRFDLQRKDNRVLTLYEVYRQPSFCTAYIIR